MSRTYLAIALAFAIPAATAASLGPQGEAGPHRGPNVERLARVLELTAQQKTQLEAIFAEQWEKRRALREETRVRMREVLSDEQLAQLDEMRQGRRGRHGGKFCDKAQRRSGQ